MSPELPPPWPILVIVLPLLLALVAFVLPRRPLLWGVPALLLSPVLLGLLTLAVGEQGAIFYPLGGWPPPLAIGLWADGLALWLLWVGLVVNLAVGIYALRYFQGQPALAGFFPPLWLLLWAAFNGIILGADLFNIYVGLELLGLAAVALTALGGGDQARRAALRYLLLNIFGSLCFLLAVILLYRQSGSLSLELFNHLNLGGSEPAALLNRLALALLTLGLLIKSALFPLHFWLPPAHAGAKAPVSALLSALVVKASLFLLLRIWLPLLLGGAEPGANAAALAPLCTLLGLLGAAAIGWGSLQALRCRGFKELIAYSTVAQMGYLFLAFPLFLSPRPEAALYGLLFILVAHALAKAALFMVAGSYAAGALANLPCKLGGGKLQIDDLSGISRLQPLSSIAMILGVVSLIGLPPSGGFIGKWHLLQAVVAGGGWGWGWALVILGGSLLSLSYLLRPVAKTFSRDREQIEGDPGCQRLVIWPLELPALLLALAAILLGLFPWAALAGLGGGLPFAPVMPLLAPLAGGGP